MVEANEIGSVVIIHMGSGIGVVVGGGGGVFVFYF